MGPDQSNTELEPRPLVGARESEGVGTDRIPTRNCWRAPGCQSRPVSLHLCPPQNSDGAGAEGMRRKLVLERAAETLDRVQTQR